MRHAVSEQPPAAADAFGRRQATKYAHGSWLLLAKGRLLSPGAPPVPPRCFRAPRHERRINGVHGAGEARGPHLISMRCPMYDTGRLRTILCTDDSDVYTSRQLPSRAEASSSVAGLPCLPRAVPAAAAATSSSMVASICGRGTNAHTGAVQSYRSFTVPPLNHMAGDPGWSCDQEPIPAYHVRCNGARARLYYSAACCQSTRAQKQQARCPHLLGCL